MLQKTYPGSISVLLKDWKKPKIVKVFESDCDRFSKILENEWYRLLLLQNSVYTFRFRNVDNTAVMNKEL